MRFRPCIDLHQGKVKQIVGSTLTDNSSQLKTNFESDQPPSYFAELYKKDDLPGGHVIMLGPGNEDAAVNALNAYKGGMQIGGGITPDNARRYLDEGASHVIVTSYVFKDGIIHYDRLESLVKTVGKDRLVLDLSCKKIDNQYRIVTDRWQNMTNERISAESLSALAKYCDEFLIHAAHVEGMRQGIDSELVEKLAQWSPIPSTYAGGARSLDDLDLAYKAGNGKIDITIGSALDIFGGELSYSQVVQWMRKR